MIETILKNISRNCLATTLLAACVTVTSCSTGKADANYNIIPAPRSVELTTGDFTLNGKTAIVYTEGNDTLRKDAEHLREYIRTLTGQDLEVTSTPRKSNAIILASGCNVGDNSESYELSVTPELIKIDGASAAGTFYGIQTLRKSIPADLKGRNDIVFPGVTIADGPRFPYRGAMFDVSRHFFPADSVKKFIDVLALHNINNMHWHITDDQGWRIEIKKHPRLTEIGSKRPSSVIGHNTGEFDSTPVEGYFTQDEIRDIIAYAADRHINIVPEIDLPGHMMAALASYPELGCTGGPYEVMRTWGVSDEVLCAGNDSVYAFIDDVLEEVAELFPSEYIHIGGDECPKRRWEKCEKCQARIKELGLKTDGHSTAEQKLQSHVIHHATDFLAERGKKTIGWNEILEGGLAPGAIVMSWTGTEGGIEAARLGHDVIMTPTSYFYFDYYQTLDRANEPDAIGGYVPVSKVYSFNPIPEELTDEEAKHIIGVQANLWTEYISDFPHVLYMELPRMAALSEVQWSDPDKRDLQDFLNRLTAMQAHYTANGYPYSLRTYDVVGESFTDTDARSVKFSLSTMGDAPIHYTIDGTEPSETSPLYTEPLELTESAVIKAIALYPGVKSHLFTDSVNINKATARPISLVTEPFGAYDRGKHILNDGKKGNDDWGSTGWMGYKGNDAVVAIDLGEPLEISMVSTNTIAATADDVFDARGLKVSVSNDGKDWKQVAEETYPEATGTQRGLNTHTLTFEPVTARYVKVDVVSQQTVPDWHPAAGRQAFLFIDEIVVE